MATFRPILIGCILAIVSQSCLSLPKVKPASASRLPHVRRFMLMLQEKADDPMNRKTRQMGMMDVGMGMGMDMSMGVGMNMGMNLGMSMPSLSGPLTSMSNPLTLQMPFAPNPFYYQMYPQRRHQLSLDGNGQDFLDQPLNPYEKVLNSKYPTSPFERLFGKGGSTPSPFPPASYQTNNGNGGGGMSSDDSGYMGSYSGSYESGGFGFQFGRRSTMQKAKVRLAAIRSDVYYQKEAYWNNY